MKRVVFNQPFGLGDILFLQSLAVWYKEQGFQVVFPVVEAYEDIARHFPDVLFVPRDLLAIDHERQDIHTMGDTTVIPFRFADRVMKVPYAKIMKAKYDMVGADYNDWRTLTFFRYNRKQDELKKLLGITNKPYTLINKDYGMKGVKLPAGQMSIPNPYTTVKQVVELKRIEGFTLLDWAAVIEGATNIITPHTSLHYLLEVLDLKCEPDILLRMPLERTHVNYQYLFKKRYKWHNLP